MTTDGGTSPEPDDSVVALLRDAPWSLPVDPTLVDDVVREVARRRRRRITAITVGAAAAVALVVGGASLLARSPGSEQQTPAPAASGTSTSTTSPSLTRQRVTVGAYSFAVPNGWVVDPMVSSGSARFGADGLQNDGAALGTSDMPIELVGRRIRSVDNSAQVYLTVVSPRPTAAHPGPSPAPDPTDRRAAVATILEYGAGPRDAAEVATVAGLPLGPATRYTTSRTDLTLVESRDHPVVIEVESVRTPHAALLDLLRSGSLD